MKRNVKGVFNPEKAIAESEWPKTRNLKDLKKHWSNANLKERDIALDNTKPYYLDEKGGSVDENGNEISKDIATYKWGVLDKCKSDNGEPLFVWTVRAKDGKYKHLHYGTRWDFDRMIFEHEQKNKTKKP